MDLKEEKMRPELCEMTTVSDYENYARSSLRRSSLSYYQYGAGDGITLRENIDAYKRYLIIPRYLRGISHLDLSTTVLGHVIDFPVCVSPTGSQRGAHVDAEVATARACGAMNTVMTLSSFSSISLEEVAARVPDTVKWFQVQLIADRNITFNLVKKAEKAGYNAIVLTIDDIRRPWRPGGNKMVISTDIRTPNLTAEAGIPASLTESEKNNFIHQFLTNILDFHQSWEDVESVLEATRLPVIVKGILSVEDALEAVKHGVKAILVSNHGARQQDCLPATIDVLAGIVNAVNGKAEIYVDGGVRSGIDVFKALALGARAVFVGRPVIYGLAYDGKEGVCQVLTILKKQLENTMLQAGCSNVSEINSSLIRRLGPVLSKM